MGLINLARAHVKRFTSDANHFGVPIVCTAPNDDTVTLNGYATLHHTSYDEEGILIDSKVSSIAISEDLLINYPVRNSNGDVDLSGHTFLVAGKSYMTRNFYPDETLGLIVVILQEWQA